MTTITHHHLTAEAFTDEDGPAVLLSQEAEPGEPLVKILIHPWQLRAICEQLSISANDSQAARTIATLQRRMMGLHDRIEALADWMARHSDHDHADLSYETAQLHALLDLAREWCLEFAEIEPSAAPATQPAAKVPKSARPGMPDLFGQEKSK